MPITLEADNSAESVVLECLQQGRVARFENGLSDEERTLHAAFLRALALTRQADPSVAPAFVEIENAIIAGTLLLDGIGSNTAPLPPLTLTRCSISSGIDLSDSAWTSITLDRCRLDRLTARGLRVESSLVLKEIEFESEGPVIVDLRAFVAGANLDARELGRSHRQGCQLLLDQADIGGSVHLTGAALVRPGTERLALSMNGIAVKSDVLLDSQHQFEVTGAISIVNAAIGGHLSFRGARIDNGGKECLVLDGTTIGGDLIFDEDNGRRFEANGAMCLRGVTVDNSVYFTGAKLKGEPDALLMTGSKIGANLILNTSSLNRFEASGGVGLARVSVGAQLRMQGASLFGGEDLFALDLNQADIRGSALLCSDGKTRFEAAGLVYLYAANIGRNLVLNGSRVGGHLKFASDGSVIGSGRPDRRPHNDAERILDDMALDLRQITVRGRALLGVAERRHQFEARGLVCFNGAKIGSEVFLKGASLYNPKGWTLSFDSAEITRNVSLDSSHGHRFKSRGSISGWGCTIGGGLYCNGAFLRKRGGPTLKFDQAKIHGAVFLRESDNFKFAAEGAVLFERARIEGDFNCDGARLFGREGVALSLDDAVVTGNVLMQSTTALRFESLGEIRLERTQIGGALNFTGARLRNPGKVALHAFDASIGADVSFSSIKGRQFKARGELLLSRVTIKGRLTCSGALLHDEKYEQPYRREEKRRALSLYGGVINDKVVMESAQGFRFRAIGFVDLSYTRIGAGVICTATCFENPDGTALSLEGAKVTGDVYLTDVDHGSGDHKLKSHEQFEALGDVDLQAVEISGDLSCDGTFRSERYGDSDKSRGKAIVFDNGRVRHRWYVRLTEHSIGEVSLRGGHVGMLDDNGGENWGPLPEGLGGRHRRPKGLKGLFESICDRILSKVMAIQLWLSGGEEIHTPNIDGKVEGIKLLLDGFTYDRFGPWAAPRRPAQWWIVPGWWMLKLVDWGVRQNIWVARRAWLRRQYRGSSPRREDYFPQPHEQAARALFAMGHSYDARRLLNDRAAYQTKCGADELISRLLMFLYRWGFGCGYLPNKALFTVVLWAALGWSATEFALAQRDDNSAVLVKAATSVEIVRSLDKPDARPASPTLEYRLDYWNEDGTIHYWPHGRVDTRDIACTEADISPLLYAIDTMLPVLDLHMEDKCEVSSDFPGYRRIKAFYAMMGWIVVALAAFTWTGVFRRMPT